MDSKPVAEQRTFKTAWFSKAAKQAKIADQELCIAIKQVMQGHADDLGGEVFKKRLNKNLHRSIILARGGRYWIYTYLFAKQNPANIDQSELAGFRIIASNFARMTDQDVLREVALKELKEICLGKE